ncbi:MAG: hypothetical protein CSA55_04925 [Ilumatobacter coccineus]|uniref:Uncharacterized protein n=1 Tax=Ilumatobacter coccineus TaxID=467094 RepID=A0A2G6K8T3_9ACTN|nr:MAG: hypothetical protein CSA55_04925 [Ilumatobacter coccineus]
MGAVGLVTPALADVQAFGLAGFEVGVLKLARGGVDGVVLKDTAIKAFEELEEFGLVLGGAAGWFPPTPTSWLAFVYFRKSGQYFFYFVKILVVVRSRVGNCRLKKGQQKEGKSNS